MSQSNALNRSLPPSRRCRLRQVDVEFMRRLQNKVNIVPVIAKADGLTSSELRALKDRIMSDLDRYKIDIYRLPECDSDEEEEIKRLDKDIKVRQRVYGPLAMCPCVGRGLQRPANIVLADFRRSK